MLRPFEGACLTLRKFLAPKINPTWHSPIKCITSNAARITVSPSSCLMDDPVHITILGLDANKVYTLHTSVKDQRGHPYASVAHYRSDENGMVDLKKTPSEGGHFAGLHPMAPFAYVFPLDTSLRKPRISVQNVDLPFTYQLAVYENAVGPPLLVKGTEAFGAAAVCSTAHQRHFMGEGCTRALVKHGRVRAALHLPPGDGPFPGVIDLSAASGGIRELRSAMLAARGCAVLSLAYFGYDGLPPTLLLPFNTAYFQEAADFLLSHEKVKKGGVGLFGASKGGDVGLSAAVDVAEVQVAVVANSSVASIGGPMHYKDGSITKGLGFDFSKIQVLPNHVLSIKQVTADPLTSPESIIPVEKIRGHVLWYYSPDDCNFDSIVQLRAIKERLKEKNPEALDSNWEFMEAPGSGHIIEPPYFPYVDASYHPLAGGTVLWGGNALQHAEAANRLWHRMLQLYHEKITA